MYPTWCEHSHGISRSSGTTVAQILARIKYSDTIHLCMQRHVHVEGICTRVYRRLYVCGTYAAIYLQFSYLFFIYLSRSYIQNVPWQLFYNYILCILSPPSSQPKFLGDVKTPVLAVFLHGVRNDKKIGGLQLVVYADIDSASPRVQVFVSNLTDSSKWKLCADAAVRNAHKAAVRLKNSDMQLYASQEDNVPRV